MAQPRTAIFSRHQVGGLFTIVDLPKIPNDVFFVCSVTGTDEAGAGFNPDRPTATLDYAIGLCTASKCDKIYILPGHVENITAADTIDCDVIGIDIEGLGHGSLIPTFTATAAAGSITVDVANVKIKNIKLVAGFATGCTAGITVTADGDYCTLDGIIFRDNVTDEEWLIHITVATTVTDLTIKNCDFVGLAGESMTNSILFAGTSSNFRMFDCIADVDSSDSVLDHDAGKATQFLLARNISLNEDGGTAGYCVEMEASSTGQIVDGKDSYNKNDAVVHLAEAAFFTGTYGGNSAGLSAEINPAETAVP